ncbi:hypothetical protein RI129_010571 [Pyrocoelia pectoralis]|uniref:G-protein coupled receptors family 2 profile 2 domain-containing protein n=1 Tax=Pyrocoelia pectoralis TaxID=417401 RepID=A0AAN7UYW6_9COLE
MKCVIRRLLVQVIFLSFVRTVFNSCEIAFNHEKEGEAYPFDTYVYNGTISDCKCDDLTNICVRKCCDLNYMLSERKCTLNSTYDFKIDVYDGIKPVADFFNFRYVAGKLNCVDGVAHYRLEPSDFPDDAFYLQRDGSLWQPAVEKYIIRERYCLENFEDIGLSALVCLESVTEEKEGLYTLGMMISMPFLLATFIVYGLLPERNLHGKSLMSYVISLFGAYLCLVVMQEHTDVVGPGCIALGTLCLFFFMVSFLWMNVMSIDIWWTFRWVGIRGLSGNKKEVERKRFLLYTAYSWGVPLIFVIIVTIINASAPFNAWYKPGIGDGQCWFTHDMGVLLYFYGPLATIIVINVALFTLTALTIKKTQKDTKVLRQGENKSSEDDQQRFKLYLKLLLAMGGNWSLEVLSWAWGWQIGNVPEFLNYVIDLCNVFYGVLIFFMFTFKKTNWIQLQKRMKILSVLLFYMRLSYIYAFCEQNSEEKAVVIASNIPYSSKSFIYNGTISDCECEKKICIRKCCDSNYVVVNKTCVPHPDGASFEIYDKTKLVDNYLNRHIIGGYLNCKGNGNSYMLEPSEDPDDEFFIQKDGRLWQKSEQDMIQLDSYCVDEFDGQRAALVCFPQKNPNTAINIVGMIISMPFLFATFVIYSLLPDLNIHRKSLMCYVLSLLLAYIFLSIINSIALTGFACITIPLCCLFFFISSFFWMNVMSIDIWRTFSGKREVLGNTRELARRRFIIYNVYAWGVPFVLVMLIAILNSLADEDAWYSPSIGVGFCWFHKNISELLYFYGLLAMIIVANLSLFGVTALKIRKLQRDTEILRSEQYKKHADDDRKRFKLYIRLSLAMGVNWIMEIVSWAVNWRIGSVPPSVWYLTDFCNAVYGVIIFFIFVFKKKIWKSLRARYPCGNKESWKDETTSTQI